MNEQTDDDTYIDIEVQISSDRTNSDSVAMQNGYKSDLIDRMFLYSGTNMVNRYRERATRFGSLCDPTSYTPFDKVHYIAIWILNCNMPEFDSPLESTSLVSQAQFKRFGNEPIIEEFNFRSLTNPEKYVPLNNISAPMESEIVMLL